MEKMIGPQLIAQIDWNSLYKLIGKLVLQNNCELEKISD